MPSKVQLIGGAFQDSEGNVLVNGYLTLRLSQDASISGVGNICSGIEITIQLDANGNAVASPAQSVWGNDNLLPVNTYYRVTGFTKAGQPAWGPNNQQVEGSGTFDLGTWVPNSVISWQPVVNQPITLKNNGVLNSSQSLLNLESLGSTVIITDEGSGNINLESAGGGTEFDTPGQGWFYGGKDYSTPTGGGSGIFTNLGVNCLQLILESKYVVSSMAAFTITGGGANRFMLAGLYSADGSTKLIDGGANFLDMSSSSQHCAIATFSPVILTPGVYWFAWGSYDNSNAGTVLAHEQVSGLSGLLNNWSFPWASPVTPIRFGTASNPITGGVGVGVMPSSLGTITPFEFGSEGSVPVVMFRV